MKFKKLFLILLLLAILTITAVNATDNNTTNELIKIEGDNSIELENPELNRDNNKDILEESSENEILYGNQIKIKLPSKTIEKSSNEEKYTIEISSDEPLAESTKVEYNVTNPLGESKKYFSTLTKTKSYNYTAPVNILFDTVGVYNITAKVKLGVRWYNTRLAQVTVIEPPVKTVENNNAVKSDNTDYRSYTHLKASSTKVKYKSNSYFKINHYWWSYYSSKEPVKFSKIFLKVWTGKKTKTYKLITNWKGIAKFNTKKLKVGTHKVKITFKGDNYYKGTSIFSKIIVKKTPKKEITKKTTKKKKSSKYKIITTKGKFHKITKKSGKFKVETCIYDFSAGIRAQYKCIDILLYKNGKQIRGNKYSVKYKLNGKWTGWTKYGIYETCHQRHYVKDSVRVDQIKIKVNKKCNSFV